MKNDDHTHLPVHGEHCVPPRPEEEAGCSPKAYVSNEEKSILATMRALRTEAETIRTQLEVAGGDSDRRALEARLADLRDRRRQLSQRWEEANRRKMIMLGHLPPDDTTY